MKHTEVILSGAALSCAAAMAAAQIWPSQPIPDETVSDNYLVSKAWEIRFLGVCDAVNPNPSCWDTTGRLDAELLQKVQLELRKDSSQGVGRATELPFLFRKKNRIAVFQVPTSMIGRSAASITGYSDGMGTRLYSLAPAWDGRQEVRLDLVSLHTDRSQTSAPIDVALNFSLGVIGSVASKVGATSEPGSHQVTVARIEPVKPGVRRAYPNLPGWQVVLKMKGDGEHSRLHLHAVPIDSKGMPVRELSALGVPVTPAPPKAGVPVPPNLGGRRFVYPSEPGGYDPKLDGHLWESNVKPDAVIGYQLSLSTDRTIRFKNVPLDPIR